MEALRSIIVDVDCGVAGGTDTLAPGDLDCPEKNMKKRARIHYDSGNAIPCTQRWKYE